MVNTILLKRSSVSGSIPPTTAMQPGEIAVNTYDGKLFIRGNNGTDYVGALGSNVYAGDVTATISGAVGATVTLSLASIGAAATYASVVVDTKGRVVSGSAGVSITASLITTALGYTPVNIATVGVAYGIATLDGSGKVPTSQLPDMLTGAVVYQGVWNAAINSPSLASGVGTAGHYYKVSVNGATNIDGISTWYAGDSIIFDGTAWDKINGIPDEVVSVNGLTGAVTISTISGNAGTATKWAAPIALGVSGDATGSTSVDGSAGATIAITLANSGVTAGTYIGFTVNSKGLLTSVSTPTTCAGYGITDAGPNSTVDAGSY